MSERRDPIQEMQLKTQAAAIKANVLRMEQCVRQLQEDTDTLKTTLESLPATRPLPEECTPDTLQKSKSVAPLYRRISRVWDDAMYGGSENAVSVRQIKVRFQELKLEIITLLYEQILTPKECLDLINRTVASFESIDRLTNENVELMTRAIRWIGESPDESFR